MQFNNLGYIIYDRIVRKSIMNQELFTDIMPECAASKDVAQLKDLIISLTE